VAKLWAPPLAKEEPMRTPVRITLAAAGMEATVTGSDGRTYFGDDDTMVTFDPTPGSLTTGWVTFKAMPDGVTSTAITWGNAAGGVSATWQLGSGQ
jgi:hypothetical protein